MNRRTTTPPETEAPRVDPMVPIWNRLLAPVLRDHARKVWTVIAIGLAIRVLLLPLFASVDLLSTVYVTSVLIQKHQLLYTTDPPPVYLVSAALELLVRPLISPQIGAFFSAGASYTPSTEPQALAALMPGANVLVAVLKLPYLAADLAIAFLLPRFFRDHRGAFLALLLWWFNPISIYISYMVGQYDVIATAFVVWAFYSLRSGQKLPCIVAFGLATFFELFAVLLVPFVLVYWVRESRGWSARLRAGVASLVGPLVAGAGLYGLYAVLPAYYQPANLALPGTGSNGYFGTQLYVRGAVTHPFFSGIWNWIGFSAQFSINSNLSDAILLIVLVYGLLVFAVVHVRELKWDHLWAASLATFLIIYGLSGFLVQWVLWSLPFLVLLLTKDLRRLLVPYLVFIGGYFMYTWYFEAALTGALLQVSYPAVSDFSPITALNNAGLPGLEVINVGRSLFSAACLWFMFVALRDSFLPGFLRASGPTPPGGAA